VDLKTRLQRASVESLSIERVKVGKRRRAGGSVAELKRSILAYGIIHPIVVTEDLELAVGGRRLRAAKLAGWKSIPARRVKLSRDELRELELEENLQREELDAFEQSTARGLEIEATVEELERGQAARARSSRKSPESLRSAARKQLGISAGTDNRDRQIIRDVKQFPTLESWSQRTIKKAAEAIRELPAAEQAQAERFAGTFHPRMRHEAVESLENLLDWPKPLRSKIWALTRNSDPQKHELAQTTALELPPVPDERYGRVKSLTSELKDLVKRSKKKDRTHSLIRDAHRSMQEAVELLEAAYKEIRDEVEEHLGGYK